jgi:AraC-like DNA-binding protein
VDDVICTAGPHDHPFEEQHDSVCIAAVMEGSFQYRSSQGAALLTPGAVLLGSHGHCFECGHDHGTGDRCLSFQFTPAYFEAIIADVPGTKTIDFAVPRLPPMASFIPLIALAEAARQDGDESEFEELALRFAGAVAAMLANIEGASPTANRRDERRISEAVRRIEAEAHEISHERLSVTALAREAAMSPYHFLRRFQHVVGMTPHQFVLRARLHDAAVRVRRSDEPISAIAFDAGFNDLSTFNRRFRRVMGASPSAYRTGRGRELGPVFCGHVTLRSPDKES